MSMATKAALDLDSFDYVRKLVLDHSAIALESTKAYLVESRLAPLVHKHGLNDLVQLISYLRRTPHGTLHDQVIDAMTTNETSFFRDIHPFETLRTTIVPKLIERRAGCRQLLVWSAACSSGQEAYSIAVTLREHFPQLASWRVRILATDLSEEMLRYAKAATYTQAEANRGLSAALLVKYFHRDGLHWVVNDDLRALVEFQRHNLNSDWTSLPTMDVIFMRNVLIYFNIETKRAILEKVHQKLAKDGTLFLGGAETTLGLDDRFERVCAGKTIYYCPR